jgi:hypothetical protein
MLPYERQIVTVPPSAHHLLGLLLAFRRPPPPLIHTHTPHPPPNTRVSASTRAQHANKTFVHKAFLKSLAQPLRQHAATVLPSCFFEVAGNSPSRSDSDRLEWYPQLSGKCWCGARPRAGPEGSGRVRKDPEESGRVPKNREGCGTVRKRLEGSGSFQVRWLAEPSVNESDFRCPPVVLPPRFQSFQVHCFSEPSINERSFRCPPGGATS